MTTSGQGWREVYLGGSREAEERMIAKLFVPQIRGVQRDLQGIRGHGGIDRAQHAKTVFATKNATLEISPDLPADLTTRFFVPGRSYSAIVRFSNASGLEQVDTAHDLRGVALRVTEGGRDHDFIMTNAPLSHARDARQFVLIARAVSRRFGPPALWRSNGWRTAVGFARITRLLGLREALRVLRTNRAQITRPVASLASERYWSRAPYALHNVALKYMLEPVAPANLPSAADFRADLLGRLAAGPIQFDFRVQRYVDNRRTPIEDATVEWLQQDAPPITIARLTIPAQAPDLAAEREITHLSFNPWNTDEAEFRPIGSLNRARRLVYCASAAQRHAAPSQTCER